MAVLTTGAAAQQVPLMPSHESAAPTDRDPSVVVARVNGVAIVNGDLQAAMDTRLPMSSYHRNVSPEKQAELRREALDSLIDEELRYQEAVRLRVPVAPQEVERALDRARKAYKGGPQAFERARLASGATMPQLRSGIKRGLMIKKLYDRAVAPSCVVTANDAQTFYTSNRQRFVQPEQLRPFLITIGVSPSASKKEWDEAREKAKDLAGQLAAGASFEALARQHSSDPSKTKGGDLGFVHRGRLIDEFETALKAMSVGQVSGIIQSIYGFHLIRLADIRPAAQKSFAEVKTQLVRDLAETRCSDATARWTRRLRAAAKIQIVGETPRAAVRTARAGL
jgi:parvulin-like peptidyl-prolyl isomerase